MNIEAFSKQISSYIDYNTLISAINELKINSTLAHQKSALFLGSPSIEKAEDWDLYNLIRDYLKEFKISKESLELILKMNNISNQDVEIKWLESYRFTGELRGNPKLETVPENITFKPVIAIIAESCILDILYHPINFLINSVEVFSETWRKMGAIEARAFLEPGAHSELLIYIEKRVASHYKYLEKMDAGEKSGNSVFTGYRYVCLTTDLPINSYLIQLTKDLSNKQALSTLS